VRRFYNPVSDYGYYDNYYTNTYWYSGNPAQWGMSVYMGYPWWGPNYYSYNYFPQAYWGCGWGLGLGFGLGFGFGWGYPFYGGYWGGYHGFWGGYHGYGMEGNHYYNSHDGSGNYYGPRGGVASHTNGRAISPFGAKYETASAHGTLPAVANHSGGINSVRPENSNSNVRANENNVSHQGMSKPISSENNSNRNNLPRQNNNVSNQGNNPRSVNNNSGNYNRGNSTPRPSISGNTNSQPRNYSQPQSRSLSGGSTRSGGWGGGGGSRGSSGGGSHGGGGHR
jgi:uncharacterized membrane protein YgcG